MQHSWRLNKTFYGPKLRKGMPKKEYIYLSVKIELSQQYSQTNQNTSYRNIKLLDRISNKQGR